MRQVDEIQREIESAYRLLYSDDEYLKIEADIKLSILIAELELHQCHG